VVQRLERVDLPVEALDIEQIGAFFKDPGGGKRGVLLGKWHEIMKI
jgi:hypothetical protein